MKILGFEKDWKLTRLTTRLIVKETASTSNTFQWFAYHYDNLSATACSFHLPHHVTFLCSSIRTIAFDWCSALIGHLL